MMEPLRNLFRLKFLLLFFLFIGQETHAQTPTFYNNNTASPSNAFPWSTVAGKGIQNFFGPNTFPNSYNGLITKVYYKVSPSVTTTYTDLTIKLAQTTNTALTTGALTTNVSFTTVYYASSVTLSSNSSGWLEITLQTPYLYDPNLAMISDVFNCTASNTGMSTANFSPGPSPGRTYSNPSSCMPVYSGQDASTAAFGFDLIPAAPCSGIPVAGTATVTNANPCSGTSVILNLTGNSTGVGITYQWQSATNQSGPWTNIDTAKASTSQTLIASATNYYRAKVKCASDSTYSDSVLVTVPTPFPGGTYTINSALPPGSGNFQSFAAAVSAINCGISGPVVFNVAPGSGPYNEQVIIPASVGASSTNTVTFNGNNNVLTSAGSGSNYATLRLDGADYITVKNLTITASDATNGFGIHLGNGADNNTFDSCSINASTSSTGTAACGVVMSGSPISYSTTGANGSNNTFSNCTVTGGYFGFTFYGASTTGNANNNIIKCLATDYYIYGAYYYYQTGGIVSESIFERPTRTPTTFYGVALLTGCTNILVEKNIIRKPATASPSASFTAYPLYCTAAASIGNENKFYNNIVGNIEGIGTRYALYINGATYIKAYHNTIVIDYPATSASTIAGIYASGTAGLDIKNNNIVIAQPSSGAKYGLYYSGAGKISDYNNVYVNAGGTGASYYGYSSTGTTTAATTLALWKQYNSNNSYDVNSLDLNPLFLSPQVGNFMPTNASLDDKGTPVGVLTDISNSSRSATTPDIGAIEFAIPPCGGFPNPGIASLSSALICPNTSFDLILSGFTIAQGITIQWQSSPSGLNIWSNISGATTAFYTVSGGITSNTDYQAIVTCTNGNNSLQSNTVSALLPAALPAGTYTINSAQSTGGSNFQSFTDAVAMLSCAGIAGPVVFNVSTGTYNEQVLMGVINGSSSTNTITFNGNNSILTSAGSGSNYATLSLNGTDYVTVKNLTITASNATNGFGVYLGSGADNNTFDSCSINASTTSTGTAVNGVVMSGSPTSYSTSGANGSNNTFSNCTVTGGYFGFTFYGATTAGNANNNIINCLVTDFYIYGAYYLQQTGGTISKSIFERPTRTSLSSFYGITLTTGCENILVEKNIVRKSATASPSTSFTSYPLYCTAAASLGNENKFYNNLVGNIEGIGTRYAFYITGSYVKAYHNTLVIDHTASSTSTLAGIYVTGTAGIDIKNNNIVIAQPSSAAKYGLYYSGAGKISDYNNVYVNAGGTGVNYYGYSSTGTTTTATTLALWKQYNSNNSYDVNSLNVDPQFSNPATGNYLFTNMAMDNLGLPVGVATDILNVARDLTTPDMGAYEVPPPPCSAPPAMATTVANPSSGLCSGASVQLSMTGITSGTGQTYQWESSMFPGGPFNMIVGATSATYTFTATSSLYYRCLVTCSGFTTPSSDVLVSVPPLFPAGTYTINSAMSTGSGNFQTFAAAIAAINCGIAGPVVFNVVTGSGPYNEQINIPAISTTSSTNTVTFNGNGCVLTQTLTTTGLNYATLNLDGADYFTFNDLTIQALGATYGFAVHLMNSADNNTFSNCTINANTAATATTSGCVSMSGSAISYSTTGTNGMNNTFTGCTLTGGYFGFFFYGNGSNTTGNTNNSVFNCTVKEFNIYGAYYYYQGNATLSGSIFERPTRATPTTFYPIYLTTGSSNILVEKNIVRKPATASPSASFTGYPLFCGATATVGNENKFYNNVVGNIEGIGVRYGLYITGSYVKAYHNTIVLDHTASSTSIVAGIYVTGTAGVDIRNNNVFIAQPSSAAKYGLYYSSAGKTSDYNNVYINAGGTGVSYYGYSSTGTTTTATTLALWKQYNSNNSYDVNSWDLNPLFPSPSMGNFTPTNGLLDNLGTPLGIATDINNASRSTTTPDLGAIEFTPPPPPANDNGSGAFMVTVGGTCTGNALTNVSATLGAGEPAASCAGNNGDKGVWYKFIAPASGAVKISTDFTSSSLSDTRVALFSVTDSANYATYTLLGCDDENGVTSGRSILYATGLTPGTRYYVLVDGTTTVAQGNFCLEVTELAGSMLASSGTCAAGKANVVSSTYTGWSSMVNSAGQLIANVRPVTGTSAGTYNVSLTKNTAAVRQVANQYYLDRNLLINGPTTGNFNVQLFLTPAELTAFQAVVPSATLSNLNVTRQTGSTCVANFNVASGTNSLLTQTGNGTANGVNWIMVTTPGFSNFYINTGSTPLIIELGDISAINSGERNRIDWNTVSETDGDYFELERSADGTRFTRLSTIAAKGEASAYSYWDERPIQGVNHYRIKMVDKTGKFTYSDVVTATVKGKTGLVVDAYPNPVSDVLSVQVYGATGSNATVSVADVTGKVVRMVSVQDSQAEINMTGLTQGVYLVKYADSKQSQTIKVNKQ